MKTLFLFSAGIDSTVCLWDALRRRENVQALTVNYGQHARTELIRAYELARGLKVPHHVLDAPNLQTLLTRGSEPFLGLRGLLIAMGAAQAVASGCENLAYCERREIVPPFCFATAAQNLQISFAGELTFLSPAYWPAHEMLRLGVELLAPIGQTWSCHRSGGEHCGRCRGCIGRQRRFRFAGLPDPTVYDRADVLPFEVPTTCSVDWAA